MAVAAIVAMPVLAAGNNGKQSEKKQKVVAVDNDKDQPQRERSVCQTPI